MKDGHRRSHNIRTVLISGFPVSSCFRSTNILQEKAVEATKQKEDKGKPNFFLLPNIFCNFPIL
jgi:hypothetical protein